ncbi:MULTISPECIES: signal peptidase I [Paenarthrobacter]|jgi:signal peptidase I|uniref:signal peptidase I n=1 Tax=Paenarthrobacter TaxID=1742992 RepID=UPI002366C10A|nr:signal peptidase I [Paenarthrobacter sp. AB444]MDD7833744.1 signal peptidase I [Paenarthrobacter sp. AB444]
MSRRALRGLSAAIVPLIVILAARAWLVEPFTVSSDSMEPAIGKGSVVLLYKPAVASGLVRRGVVVAFADPEDGNTTIKRVIALEGQVVAIRDAELYVDGQYVREPLIDHSRIDATYFGPLTVPAGKIFVLGDNRGVSIDSRDYGAVPLSAVRGAIMTGRY